MRAPRSSFHHAVVTCVGHPPLEFAGRRDDGVPHVQELPGRLDRGKDVKPPVARGLDEGLQPGLREYAPQLPCNRNGLGEPGTGLRVEVDPQLVRIVRFAGPGGPGVEDHRIHLHRPHRGGDFVNDQLGMRASAGIDDVDRADEVRGTLGRVLGEELLAVHRVLEPLERYRPVPVRGQEGVPDVHHVPGQVQLGQSRAGPETLAGLDTRNSRSPCGPLTVRWTSSLAMGTTYPGGVDS